MSVSGQLCMVAEGLSYHYIHSHTAILMPSCAGYLRV
jgi:hypothetical protein